MVYLDHDFSILNYFGMINPPNRRIQYLRKCPNGKHQILIPKPNRIPPCTIQEITEYKYPMVTSSASLPVQPGRQLTADEQNEKKQLFDAFTQLLENALI